MSRPKALPPESLQHQCKPSLFSFKTTDELPGLEEVLGQPRALRALELGSEVTGPGFNIFVSGLPDSGRTTLTRDFVKRKAEREPIPDDWCYAHNFENPYHPKVIPLPAGKGSILKKELVEMISRCRQEIQDAFLKEEYINEHNRLTKTSQEHQEEEFNKIQNIASKSKFAVIRTTSGFKLVPVIDGKPLTPKELDELTEEHQQKLHKLEEKLEQKALETALKIRELAEVYHQEIEKLNAYTTRFAIEHLVNSLKDKYSGIDEVLAHINSIEMDIVENTGKFRDEVDPASDTQWLKQYEINLLVDNTELKGAPVVMESQPTYHNLFGRIEHHLVMGVSQTDFTMIRPGAFHRANGGYLLLPAREVLLNPFAWQGLERALRDGEIRMMELSSQFSLVSTTSLEPEPIPLSVKVILFGTPVLYEMLRLHDVNFGKLFKVRAEFATLMDRTDENTRDCALFIKSVVDEHQLLSFDTGAVAKIIDHSSRMTGDQQKLSTRFGQISDLVREAAYWAQKEGGTIVTAESVDHAIQEKDYRNNLSMELIQEWIEQDTILIDITGKIIGQVNALSLMVAGDYYFGRPSRVTASVYAGKEGIIDIEKQAKLGGPIHTKGVLIISGLLGRRYGRNKPISLTARLTFEQSYSGVEGDSASLAETCALLSVIGDIPIRQDLALTGSINQLGEVQAIGGVNEKIEGFFAVCQNKGLTGSQGVIIPRANQRNLMLKKEVIEAVEAGLFQVWPVNHLDDVLALLTEIQPGKLEKNNTYPEGTFNRAVDDRLVQFQELLKADENKES